MSTIEQYQCKSYVDDNLEVQDCECGKCGYEHNVRRWKEAYTAILKVCEKYPTFYDKYGFDDIRQMEVSARNHLMLIEWYEKYGLKINHEKTPYRLDYFAIDDYMAFSYFRDAKKDSANRTGKSISWSDDGRQPKNEWLLKIGFSTGAYIFGEDYPKEFFQEFFDELASYKPDFTDRNNSSLYWKLENAKDIFNNYFSIFEKYRKQNREDSKKRELERKKAEIARLQKELES